jgi:hypothetical protein
MNKKQNLLMIIMMLTYLCLTDSISFDLHKLGLKKKKKEEEK